MQNKLEITVRSTHTDMMGHVNNATYQEYLEWGRFDWFRHSGIPWAWVDIMPRGLQSRASVAPPAKPGDYPNLAAVVARVEIDYLREARMDDRLVVETELAHLGTKSARFAQRIRHEDGGLACKAQVITVVFDVQTRKSAALPDSLRPHFERLLVAPID